MLPFFFRHYDRLVTRYFIYDNQSTDRTLDILKAHPRVTVLPLMLEGESFVESSSAQVNKFWHKSRGEADWVVACNIDELFWHADLPWYLRECRRKGITFLGSEGYQMVSRDFPKPRENLARTYRHGVRDKEYDKPSFFNPDAITDSGFGIARHRCNPKGNVVRPAVNEILMLHYKYIGQEYVTLRHAEMNARRRPRDVERKFGWQYDPEPTQKIYAELMAKSTEIVRREYFAGLKRRFWGPPVEALKTG